MSSIDLNFLCGDGGDGRRRGGKTFRAAAGELDNGAIGAGGGQNGNSVDWPRADREFKFFLTVRLLKRVEKQWGKGVAGNWTGGRWLRCAE